MMPEINPTKAITDLCEDAKCVLGVRISLAFPSLVGVIAHAKCVVLWTRSLEFSQRGTPVSD